MRFKCTFFLVISIILIYVSVAAAAQETLARIIVRHRDFFLHLNGYDECMLADVEILDRGEVIGIILLDPEGFEQNLVYNMANMLQMYAKSRILDKDSRDFLMRESIRISEVKKLAYAAKIRAAELARVWKLYEGKPGNLMP